MKKVSLARTSLAGFVLVVALVLGPATQSFAQDSFDTNWYNPSNPYVKLGVTSDGVHAVSGAQLADSAGVNLGSVNPATLKLFRNGVEVPILYNGGSSLGRTSSIVFAGERNTGEDELWLFDKFDPELRGSDGTSAFSDTTHYWLSWGGPNGLRYANSGGGGGSLVASTELTTRLETDSKYYNGDQDNSGIPLYTRAEGFYMTQLAHSSTDPKEKIYTIPLPGLLRNASNNLKVEVQLNGQSASRHLVSLLVETIPTGGGDAVYTEFDKTDWTGFQFSGLSASIPQDRIPAGADQVRIKVFSDNTFNGQPNQVLVDYVEVKATRTLEAIGGQSLFEHSGSGTLQYKLNGFSATANINVLRPDAAKVFRLSPGSDTFSDAGGSSVQYFASAEGFEQSPVSVRRDVSSNLAASSNTADYLIVTRKALLPSANAMANYRRSAEGRNHEVMVIDVQDIYDQFDYGRPTPKAIQRFVRSTRNWSKKPQFLVIWGDALYPSRNRTLAAWEVPSFGRASSDGWFATQTDGIDDYIESLAVGRISIRDNNAGNLFVDKIKTYESAPDGDWQKKVIILAGGKTAGEQTQLQSASNRWAATVSGAPFGGLVKKWYKEDDIVISQTLRDSISTDIRGGAAWLGYFGHSSTQTWEIATDLPRDYNNSDRLPIAVSLGCYTGAFAAGNATPTDVPVFGEELVTGSINGAIAHWGGSTSSFISTASSLADPFYNVIFVDGARTLGEAVREAKRRYLASNTSGQAVPTSLQYNLIGDPATRISMPTQPDLHLQENFISVDPFLPNVTDENLTVTARISNRGVMTADSVTVLLQHDKPNGVQEYSRRIAPFGLFTELDFVIPVSPDLVGENSFTLVVDSQEEADERDESNNRTTKVQVVFGTGVALVSPVSPGFVSTTTPALQVVVEGSAEPVQVLMELDTQPDFEGSNLRQFEARSAGSVSWTLDPPLEEGRTYHWRARVNDPNSTSVEWKTGAFTVRPEIAGNGFAESASQFSDNDHDPLIEHENGSWRFSPFNVTVDVNPGIQIKWGSILAFRKKTGFTFIVVDKNTGQIRESIRIETRSATANPELVASQIQEAQAALNAASNGDIVVAMNRLHRVIPPEVDAMFRDLGSVIISDLGALEYWVMYATKGEPSEVVEDRFERINDNANEAIVFPKTYQFSFSEATSRSQLIGPSQKWNDLTWEGRLSNSTSSIEVSVLSTEGDSLTGGILDYPNTKVTLPLSGLDPTVHQFIRLEAKIVDLSQTTTPQLENWLVRYEQTPELILDPESLVLSADSLDEGQSGTISADVINFSPAPANGVFVRYQVFDPENVLILTVLDSLGTIQPGATASSSIEIPTLGQAGKNRIVVTVLPPGGSDPVPSNNVLTTNVVVRSDRIPPEFLVLLEGESYPSDPDPVLNTDDDSLPFVSTQPDIEVVLKDNSPYLALDDTSLITMTLNDEVINWNRPDISYTLATLENNELRVVFTPDLSSQDGTHTFRMWAFDASGNPNPTNLDPYQVHFRTQSETEVETLYPYPNPMNERTVFAFRLLGQDPSLIEDFRIRLFTLSGQLIREFDLVDDPAVVAGSGLNIGWNQVGWDGTDADGDLVANGVYLYKVILRADGQDLEVNNEAGIEKLVVIR